MTLYHWNKELETGIALIDQQHRQILEAANAMAIRHKCGKDKTAVKDCLGFLQQYIQYHFQSEEAFQVECGYRKYRYHQAQHTALTQDVRFFTVRLGDSGFSCEEIERFYEFLTDWIKMHILQEDLDFAKCYQEFACSSKGYQ